MRFTFICNACAIVEQDGSRLLMDPWLNGGAFEGSWYHYPPLQTRPADVATVDYLYISHLHPDHFDPETLSAFRRDIPIVVLDHGQNFLTRVLRGMGFIAIHPVKDGATASLGPFRLSLFAPFAKHAFHEASIGNLLDSAIVIEAGGQSILNTNDNALVPPAAQALRERFGRFNLALLNYNAAGPYPACFNNLTPDEKIADHARVLDRNIKHLVAMSKILEPQWVMPFAGAYVLGGRQAAKNEFLGTTTWDDAAERARRLDPSLKTLVMQEGHVFDLNNDVLVNGPYTPVDTAAQQRYIDQMLSGIAYPHEFPTTAEDDDQLASWLSDWLSVARDNLWQMQERFNLFPATRVLLNLPNDRRADIAFDKRDITFGRRTARKPEPYLEADLDPRLLARILSTAAHWNNAEIGCHIEFWRQPNTYNPDVHAFMSFLHIPRAQLAQALSTLPEHLAECIAVEPVIAPSRKDRAA
jgi:UDP-MurNAc hydroxylase